MYNSYLFNYYYYAPVQTRNLANCLSTVPWSLNGLPPFDRIQLYYYYSSILFFLSNPHYSTTGHIAGLPRFSLHSSLFYLLLQSPFNSLFQVEADWLSILKFGTRYLKRIVDICSVSFLELSNG